MIRVVVLYPNTPGTRFDFDYYLKRHTPMLRELGAGVLRDVRISRMLATLGSAAPPEHVCACTLDLDSQEALGAFLAAHGPQIIGDIPNYTDTQPSIQVCEILD